MNKMKGKRILIFQQRGWAINIGHFLAKKLQGEGCRLAAITLKRTTHEFILNQSEVKYDMIISNDEIMGRPKDYLKGDTFSLAEICRDLGIDSIWPLVSTLRNHVRSYKDKYYYGFKQNVPDEDIIDYVMAVYKCIREIFGKFKPDFIIAPNFVSLPHIMISLYAERRGIKMVSVTDSKIRGIYIFSYSYRDDKGSFYNRVDELNTGQAETKNRKPAKEYISKFRESFIGQDYTDKWELKRKKRTLWQNIRFELSPYRTIAGWYLKKHQKKNFLESTGITIDYRPPRIILRDHYSQKRYRKFMNRFNYYPFEKIKKFVYFPLQFQPEASIDVIAPYFNNQIEIARQIALSLPDDYTLVVKEHPEMIGLRPPSYIDKIDRTVNVKLVDYRISNEEILKKADLIIAASGTTITEAAFLNKPVIQFGNLGTTLKLPNVFKHSDMTTLSEKIKDVLKINLNIPEYERRLENYVAAAYDTGFDIGYMTIWEKGKKDKIDALWEVYKKEIERAL
ncbi:MAG: hypothetical protein A2Y98_02930 [Candidatus Portnoybacteria bacterium RBG_19FT_COMBO_36_7]|uniref:Capsule polysaccharide biosynthesis protein n=1 Tax=Candidatus Portnoybacteria bacterium RBG_19FT_COMBO_36_7 TaxID=1801992 RepID=A0A1G2F914_9BACT|nr:MAG: hypothetical protein A2Y98_02930 [Candidatus Portnoybacteria bacterium RBG_19FT_COMBO_36_7]